mmetsp:Transcript_70255/g.121731  ORF Transcript_70255/g.121731 Transcript_70255/m.121731 type:complete len:463 (+) Transcript_70255:114-1502(+)
MVFVFVALALVLVGSRTVESHERFLGARQTVLNSQNPGEHRHYVNHSNHGWMQYHHPVREGWDEVVDELFKQQAPSPSSTDFHDLWLRALQLQIQKKLPTSAGSPVVGMFDSGIGGLSVYRELKEQFPHVNVAFVGDLEDPGYSMLSSARVAELSRDIVLWLQHARGVALTLVTCNIASYAMVQHGILSAETFQKEPIVPITAPYGEFFKVRRHYDARKKAIGIFASDSMCLSGSIQSSIRSASGFHIVANTVEFQGQANTTDCIGCRECHMAVDRMHPWEHGPDAHEVELMLRRKFKSYLDSDNKPLIDYLVFGCTHFPMLAKSLFKIFGDGVMFVDPAVYQVKVASKWLGGPHGLQTRNTDVETQDEFYAGIAQHENQKYEDIKMAVEDTLTSDNSFMSPPIIVNASCADRMGRAGVCLTSSSVPDNKCTGRSLKMPEKDKRQLLSLSLERTGLGFCDRS